jgi:hypothetical protein
MQNSALEGRVGLALFEYDFAKHGGAVGTISVGPKLLPPAALVMDGFIRVITDFVGATATLQILAVGTDDVLAETAVGALTGLLDVVPDGTAANMILTTAYTQLTFTVGTAAFTAGKMVVGLRYAITA